MFFSKLKPATWVLGWDQNVGQDSYLASHLLDGRGSGSL